MIATRHGNTAVKKGDKLAGMRVIPLVIEEEKLKAAKAAAGEEPLLELLPYVKKTAAIVATGSEVKKGLIQDTFTPVVKEKLAAYGIETISIAYSGDGVDNVAGAIARSPEHRRGPDPLHWRHERGPGRQHSRRHPGERRTDRDLRRPGAARCHVPAGLF